MFSFMLPTEIGKIMRSSLQRRKRKVDDGFKVASADATSAKLSIFARGLRVNDLVPIKFEGFLADRAAMKRHVEWTGGTD